MSAKTKNYRDPSTGKFVLLSDQAYAKSKATKLIVSGADAPKSGSQKAVAKGKSFPLSARTFKERSFRRPTLEEAEAIRASLKKHHASKYGSYTSYSECLRTADLRRRVQIEREGVPHGVIKELVEELDTSTAEFQQIVGMPKATFAKKIANREMFSGTSGQSVIGLIDLINKVDDMLDPSNPESKNFNSAAWVGRWIRTPQPALGGEMPANLMDTPSGRQSVMRVLGAIESGVYL